jgi:hypothetical protein
MRPALFAQILPFLRGLLDMPVRIYRKFTSEPREKKTREIFLTRHIWGFQLKCGYEVVLLIDSSVVSSKFFAF